MSFAYTGERPALDDVSLKIPAGTRLALIGSSGAGKSTLSALVARFYDPTEGRVLLDGRDARDCKLAWLREQVAVVLQDTVLFTGSVRENIGYGADATPEEIVEAAKAAAAHEFIRRLPDGYDTELGPQGVGLSGGQRQRIGIARTLLRNPPVIILDEPTTALDRESEAQVLQGLDRLMRGRTCILVTHSPRLARTADQIVELDEGRIVERARLEPTALPQLDRLLDGAGGACSSARAASRSTTSRSPASPTSPASAPTSTSAARAARPSISAEAGRRPSGAGPQVGPPRRRARLLRRRRGRHRHLAAVRPAAARAARGPRRAGAQARAWRSRARRCCCATSHAPARSCAGATTC